MVAPGDAAYSLGKLIFTEDNDGWRTPYLVTEPRFFHEGGDGRWVQAASAGLVPCAAPNYAAAVPNMFLTRFLEYSNKTILYIIDCRKLPRQPSPPRRHHVGLAIAMSTHSRLGGAGNAMGQLGSDILQGIYSKHF